MDELASTEEAMKYSEAMKLSQARQDEYTRMYSDTQKAPTFQTTTNTVAPDNVMT